RIARAIESIFSVFPDLRFETRRAYIRDDLVVQEWTARGTHEGTMTRSGIEVPPTGRKVEYKGMDVIPIRDGLVARKDVYSAPVDEFDSWARYQILHRSRDEDFTGRGLRSHACAGVDRDAADLLPDQLAFAGV